MSVRVLVGDCREVLATLPAGSAQACVTSPPFFRLRHYGSQPGEIGREARFADYVAALVEVGRALRRVLSADAPWWLQIGDSYAAGGNGGGGVPRG